MIRAKTLTLMRYAAYVLDQINQDESEQDKVDGTTEKVDSTVKVTDI